LTDYEKLRPYATPRQLEHLDALAAHGTQKAAAEALNIHKRNIERSLALLKRRAALQEPGLQLEGPEEAIPDPYRLRGTSTLYGKDGSITQTWVKTEISRDGLADALRVFVEELVEDVRGKAPVVKAPEISDAELLTVYPMGDPHLGMYAWAEECGEDFDIEIAERDLEEALARLIAASPPSEVGLILNLGDFFHADNKHNLTGRSGNPLDVDTRWAHVMRAGARLMIKVVKYALAKHKTVIVRNVQGNHDEHSALALSMILDAYFDQDDRVDVQLSPAEHWYYKHGKVLIGTTHGDKAKMKDLPGVMACDRPREWGDTAYRYWYCGHIHHSEVHEGYGAIVEYFRTLAAKDAWHAGEGYRAGRDMRCIVQHIEWGEIERHTIDIRRIRQDKL
jgi:hypothetical protein